jgi:hypothetical protein
MGVGHVRRRWLLHAAPGSSRVRIGETAAATIHSFGSRSEFVTVGVESQLISRVGGNTFLSV